MGDKGNKPIDETQQEKFLWKQMEELSKLRERSIESMGSIFQAYTKILTIVGALLGAGIGFFSGVDVKYRITDNLWIALSCIGFALFAYGCYIHNQLIITYINQTVYTKKINLTRRYLKPDGLHTERILLPITADEPEFGIQGYSKEDFSKVGVVAFLRWANSIVLLLSVTIFVWMLNPFINKILGFHFCSDFFKYIHFMKSLIIGLGSGIISGWMHKIHYEKKIDKAKSSWEKDLNEYEK